jgi:ribose transport system substrate-binding protein
MTQLNPFFGVIEGVMREMIEANGDVLITMNPTMDQELQINQIDDLIVQGIDLMLLNPVDAEGITPALLALQAAGIPVVNFDSDVTDIHLVDTFVGSNNYNAGFVVGEFFVQQFPDGGDVAILSAPAFQSVRDRVQGFHDAIGNHFNVVFEQDAQGDLNVGMSVTDDLLIAHPNVVAIFGGNDPSALGALAAVRAAGMTHVQIAGVDGSPDAKGEMSPDGPFVASGAQSPISIARDSVDIAYKILAGETVPSDVPVNTFLIYYGNVDTFGPRGDWQ